MHERNECVLESPQNPAEQRWLGALCALESVFKIGLSAHVVGQPELVTSPAGLHSQRMKEM